MSSPSAPWWRTEAGWCAVLGVVPVVPHALFHLAEQWAAFGGRAAWLGRMRVTSGGMLMGLLELLVVAAYVAWLVLLARLLFARRAPPGGPVRLETQLARALSAVERPAALITASIAVVHALLLWLPRWFGRASHLESYELLRTAAGTPLWLGVAAVGLTAFAFHVAAAVPTALGVLQLSSSLQGRQAARLVSIGLGACSFVMFVQLFGWHATGTGTVWPVTVVEVSDSAEEAAPAE